jgi:hypothetical protein
VSESKNWNVEQRLLYLKEHSESIQDNLKMLQTKTKSRYAQYYIMTAYMFNDPITFVSATQRWLRDIKYGNRLHQLKRETESVFPNSLLDQTLYFLIRVMHFFNFGQITEKETTEACCKYELGANNFIVTLVKNRTCNCACFSTYLKSVAEEFGYGEYIRFCMQPGHVSIVVVNPHQKQTSQLSLDTATAWNQIQKTFHLSDFYEYREYDTIEKPLVIAKIESSCDQVVIQTIIENFSQIYNTYDSGYGINYHQQIDICENDLDNIDFIFLVREIVTYATPETIFEMLFLVAEIYQEQEWMNAFIKLGLCLVEIKWIEYYQSQPLPDHIEDAWEVYSSLMPSEITSNDMTLANAKRFEEQLTEQAENLKQKWYQFLPIKAQHDKLVICLSLVYGLVFCLCPKRQLD